MSEADTGAALHPPPSPCIKVCSLNERGYCAGCLRTGEEIGRWMAMSAAEQWRLIAELALRRGELERDQAAGR